MLATGSLIALMLLAQDTSEEPLQAQGPALYDAVRFCSYGMGVRESDRFNMPPGSEMYQVLHPTVAAVMKQRGMTVGPSNAEVPDLVIRFASTQPMGRLSSTAPDQFDYASFNSDGDMAWTVRYPDVEACDIMVTGEEDYLADKDATISTMQANGWLVERDEIVVDGLMWRTVLNHPQGLDGVVLQSVFQGFVESDPKEEGVQMEVQFRLIQAQ